MYLSFPYDEGTQNHLSPAFSVTRDIIIYPCFYFNTCKAWVRLVNVYI